MSILHLALSGYVTEGKQMADYAARTRDVRKESGSRGRPGRRRKETAETNYKDI
jgi:hypothetical protein